MDELMDQEERERIGPFVITSPKDLESGSTACAMCGKLITQYDSAKDLQTPSFEQIFAEGAVPIPNFGWFCSQDCADTYERKSNVRFQRNVRGEVEYYPDGIS